MPDPDRPNCYDCVHRGQAAGSAHSMCHHPATSKVHEDPMANILAIMGGGPPIACEGIDISAHQYGVAAGWFNWPLNFDPTWLRRCDGFNAKEKDHARP